MSWTMPTLRQCRDRVVADMQSRITSGSPLKSRSALKILGTVYAGVVHTLHQHINWCFRQCFPDTAETEYLERWASIFGLARKSGARAVGVVTMTASVGSVIPESTLLVDSRGVQYITTTECEAEADSEGEGIADVPVRAVVTGMDGNLDVGENLSLVSPVTGYDSDGFVSVALEGGTNDETDAELQIRVLQTIRSPAHGGNAADYETWALSVDGVTRAWVLPRWLGLGTVGVAVVMDNADNIIPDAVTLAAVQAKIDAESPVTAAAVVFAPTPKTVDVTVKISPYSSTTAEYVRIELADLFAREGSFETPLLLSHIAEAISVAPGEFDHILLAPTVNIIPEAGEIPILGTITITAVESD